MQIHRRNMLVLGAATLGASAFAQSFPNKPVTLIVPFAPGGNIDIVARALSVPLAKALGQSVLVDNRAGGGGAIGTALVAAAHADGYTVLVATPGQISTLPQMFKTPTRWPTSCRWAWPARPRW
ncbi:Bug family tripartite tricarboxylate transporter substrate binding protein [Xylophilus rhododendri]|uniref:Bug family tripartite tricarboxylate transporter substrate binding protein n=1 Tax=Xylophilus rhododendri TaxID=2697032 RepID=UPI00227CDBD1|nr:tripartite tricarboxylate transporter substrate-binding protein [Xylophilus rhododendri]